METDISEVVDLVHSLVLQSRPPTSSSPFAVEETLFSAPVSRITVKSQPASPCNMTRSQSFPAVRKKVAIKSAPLKPPDIGNLSLFPSVEESLILDASSSPSTTPQPKRIQLKSTNGGKSSNNKKVISLNNVNTNTVSSFSSVDDNATDTFVLKTSESSAADIDRDKKLKTLEAKLTGPLGLNNNETFPSIGSSSSEAISRRASLNEHVSTPSRKTPRSAKLFSELGADRRQKLDELAEKYGKSLDLNQCRSILDELEFLFQLLNSNAASSGKGSSSSVFLLHTSAEQAYFVIRIIINQLDKLFVSLPLSILQLIVDNYPHKIPKPVRKHIDDWIETQKSHTKLLQQASSDQIPIDLAKTVTFKSEKDGRANFHHQTDFHNFCKQRDMFYSIREGFSNSNSGTGNGTSNEIVAGGPILDRSKARMSFPPVQPQQNSSSSSQQRYTDPFPLKVQSLFQMNHNPTNLFHMASLFVSHYLLEARALEVGGVPKDDQMKEFFQSNPMKLLQLNSRFSTNASAETLENDNSNNLSFRKQFLLASSSKFAKHVVDRLVMEITKAESSVDNVDIADPSQLCRTIKDTIHLSRLLGYTECLPYHADETKRAPNQSVNSIERESITREQVLFRSQQSPSAQLTNFLKNAMKSCRLTATCPWIIEYLLQCDAVTLLLPVYQDLLLSLVHIYRTLLSHNNSNSKLLSRSNRNFLRFYFGMLFSSKNFPDRVLVALRSEVAAGKEIQTYGGDNNGLSPQDLFVDAKDDIGFILVEFSFKDCFNRLRRILSWGKLEVSNAAVTGDFRHIRPIPAFEKSSSVSLSSSPSLKPISKEKRMQLQLESSFFELHSPSAKRSVDFVAERMSANFISIAKNNLFPNIRSSLIGQGVVGVRAAEKCRTKLAEEMNKYVEKNCCSSVRIFLEHVVSPSVLVMCQSIAVRKAKDTATEWIENYINPSMFPDVVDENAIVSKVEKVPSMTTTTLMPLQSPRTSSAEDPPFEVLILLHRMMRKLHSGEKLDAQLADKILSCQTFSKAPWSFVPLVDWGMSLITFQPEILNSQRMRQLVLIWKSLRNENANIINPRNLMILTKSKNSRDSWIKLGSVTQLLISEGMLKANALEEQCFALLREDWPGETHKRISEFLTIVLEAFQERPSEWNSESAQVLDWVAWLCSGQPDQD